MGSGSGNGTATNVVYSQAAGEAINNRDWNTANMYLNLIDDPFVSNMVSVNLQNAQRRELDEANARHQREMEEAQRQADEAQAIQTENTNKYQKSGSSAINSVQGRSNQGNLTGGQASGATIARKSLQGVGNGETIQQGETWY